MAGYSRRWDCLICDTPQESMDWPHVEVCELCTHETQEVDVSVIVRQRIREAFNRGFILGRKVGARA